MKTVSSTYFDLPTGRAARLDFRADGSYRRVYVPPRAKCRVLVCESPHQRVDAWDTMVGSIEVMPEEAG